MRISTKGKNAIKLMLDLATYNHGKPVKLKEIAKRQNISEKYLEQCENKSTCVSYRLWEKLDIAINDVLEGITLEDMLEWQNELLIDQYVI